MYITWLSNSYLAFCLLLFSMTTLLQLGVCPPVCEKSCMLHRSNVKQIIESTTDAVIDSLSSTKWRIFETLYYMDKKID